ncbi:hypothetical protein DL96DRAFT_1711005 [Flagelloscypha sp. PMI_526]|nr:hypothetical protein DL96DRAFT_1711005 [Flagelloscypha sp. PMI_526]
MSAPPPRGTYLQAGGPNVGKTHSNAIPCLIVQVYIYYASGARDDWKIKTLVYTVFALEILQTVIRSVDRWEIDVMMYGDPAAFDAMLLDWFSTPMLTAMTSGLVQAFFGYRIYIFSKSWIVASIVWVLTLLQSVAGIIMGAMQKGRLLHDVAGDPTINKVLLVWVVSTVVTDVMIAVLLSYYLRKLSSGIKETDRLVTNIIRLTVETGSLTAVTAIILLVLYLNHLPWFLLAGDVLGKLYSNNLMVMFNRRINFGPRQSEIHSGELTVRSQPINFTLPFKSSAAKQPTSPRPLVINTSTSTSWMIDEPGSKTGV